MLNIIEDVRNEFKIKLTDKFEEENKEITKLTVTQKNIINLMLDSPTITQEVLSKY